MSDKKIIDYLIINSSNEEKMEKNVQEFIGDGWQPIGGVCVTIDEYGYEHFYQAIVKYEE